MLRSATVHTGHAWQQYETRILRKNTTRRARGLRCHSPDNSPTGPLQTDDNGLLSNVGHNPYYEQLLSPDEALAIIMGMGRIVDFFAEDVQNPPSHLSDSEV